MNKSIKIHIQKDNDWWIGWIKNVPGINCQEKTKEELLKTLEITYNEFLDFNSSDINFVE